MKRVAPGEDDDDGISVIDLIERAFSEPEDETPQERFLRTGKKLPPPNNPHTPEGRKWIRENLKPVKKDPGKSLKRRRKKKGAPE